MKHSVKIAGSKIGSIGTKYCERHTVYVEGDTRDQIIAAALKAGTDAGLEHMIVTAIDGVKTYGSLK